MKTQEQVVFCPVVGKGYVKLGRDYLGRRVMIVGASNYCEHYCDATGCGNRCVHYGKHSLEINGEPFDFGCKCERFTEVGYREPKGATELIFWNKIKSSCSRMCLF